jgi:REP element-mobilizing transposase RayT
MIGLAAGIGAGAAKKDGSSAIGAGPEGNGASAGVLTKRELYKRNALKSIVFLERKMRFDTDNDLSKLKIALRNKIEDLRWTINRLEISPGAAGENLENKNSEEGLRAFIDYVEKYSDRFTGVGGEAVSPPVFPDKDFWAPDYIYRNIDYNKYTYVYKNFQPSSNSSYGCWPFCPRRKGGRRNTRKSKSKKSKRSQRKSRRN